MTTRFAALCLTFAVAAGALPALAQSAAPDFPAPGAATAAPASRLSPEARARDERRQRMSPDEARRDQQLEILEARAGGGSATGNTTFGRSAGQSRQYEGRTGGFMVRKFKDKRPGAKQKMKRGQTHPVGGIDPKGKRLIDKKRKRKLGLF